MDDSFERPSGQRSLRFALTIAAIFAVWWLAGCKGFGAFGQKKAASSDPPRRKPGAFAGLDGSAANENSGAAPNAPGIQGAAIAAAAATNGLSPESGAGSIRSAGAREPGASTDQGPPDDEEDSGPMLPSTRAAMGSATTRRQANSAEQRDSGSILPAASDSEADESVPPADERAYWTLETASEESGTVQTPIEFEHNGAKVAEAEIAARVNGAAIFSDDLIKQLHAQAYLDQVKRQVPPEQFRALRRALIEKHLEQQIDQEVLLQELKKKHKDEQIASMSKQIDRVFEREFLPAEIKNAKLHTRGELELQLQKQGSSIEALRASFRNRELARVSIGNKAMVRDGFDRPDVLAYYKEHLEDYAIPAKARWEQIQLKFSKRHGKAKAREKVKEILERLEKGEAFAAIAKECSEGPTASKGGQWPWTTQGSLADKSIDEALFDQPVGDIGDPIEMASSINVIRVIERTERTYQEFEEVQEDIKNSLKTSLTQKQIGDFIKQLRENATIERFTDRL